MSARRTLLNSHSQKATLWFRFRVRANQARRLFLNTMHPPAFHSPQTTQTDFQTVTESRTPLWTNPDPREQLLTLGKIENLRVALKKFDGILLQPGETLSFWRQVGPPFKSKGFVAGRELRQGCIVPSPGGGLCQLSNALYDLALRTNCEILERHRHTQEVPGSATTRDRDATVAYNHIDLRFRVATQTLITAELTKTDLILQFHTPQIAAQPQQTRLVLNVVGSSPNSCVTCNEGGCNQHAVTQKTLDQTKVSNQAFLLDAPTPELADLLQSRAAQGDTILSPIDGSNPKFARYALPPTDATLLHAPKQALARTFKLRQAKTPPEIRRTHLEATAAIAQTLAKKTPYTAKKITVDITLLASIDPFFLQGREVEIFLTRWPLKLIHQLLDQATAQLPGSPQLSDFRAPQTLVDREWLSLTKADRILTPHPYLADLLVKSGLIQTKLIPYSQPHPTPQIAPAQNPYLFFPGPTAARKGAHAVREAALTLNLPVAVVGKNLESPDFWQSVTLLDPKTHPAQNALAIIAPSIYEDRPARLLPYLNTTLPIITTEAAGVPQAPNIFTTEFNQAGCVVDHIAKLLLSHARR